MKAGLSKRKNKIQKKKGKKHLRGASPGSKKLVLSQRKQVTAFSFFNLDSLKDSR